ncbi:MAG TPA: PHB depolymerase family esterase [Oligoflexus sp.]|uniref:alpha/beta hydrolase family esterase n=1 Tax=Oligoflexus sp. TaxID=1971216 RepID=UPI002D8004F5|nr:PHB depolymerase family esterase [Oligoflexus sp.]HET9238338.1 PHB depolymerase family esterase [Oligoflexus sp.]
MTLVSRTVAFFSLFFALTLPLQAKDVRVGGDRPAVLKLPHFYNAKKSYSLIVLLHGRGNNATLTDLYLGLSRSQPFHDYLLLLPEGTVRDDGQQVWNATESCCATNNKDVDDSQYLQDLVAEVKSKYNVDPKRVYLYGHSNGGFMSYRLACDTNGVFAGVVSVAGSEFANAADCKTTTPIKILQIHGTDDSIVPFDAEASGKTYPGAFKVVERWAERNHCQSYSEHPRSLNLVLIKLEPGLDENGKPTIIGDFTDYISLGFRPETDQYIYDDCANGSKVGLWKINGSNHGPVFLGENFVGKTLKFMGDK